MPFQFVELAKVQVDLKCRPFWVLRAALRLVIFARVQVGQIGTHAGHVKRQEGKTRH
jgi:hypothetical protein